MRGPLDAYNLLLNKGTTDSDTLYFITDSANGKTLLYLGQNLISDSSNSLSPAAQAFLESLPTDETQLNDGDIQVYTIKQEEKEVTDPNTGETTTVIETKGEWVTKSIDEALPLNNIAEDVLPYVLQSIIGDEPKLDEETGQPLYKQEDGSEGTTVTDKPIYANGLSASFDTLKEIAEWLQNHSTDALDMQSRINALEEATGVNKTTTEERPKVDEEGNPIYIQETQDNGEGGTEPLYWDGLTEDDKTIENTGYPVMIPNPDGDEPSYIQEIDDDNNPLYWNVTDETLKTNNDNGNPVFIQDTETVETEVPNDVEIIKAVVGNLDTLYPQVKAAQIGTLDDRINALDSRFQVIETVLIGQDEQGIKIAPIGSLESLNEDLHTYDDNNNDTSSLVKAINMLDERMQWQSLPQEEQNP